MYNVCVNPIHICIFGIFSFIANKEHRNFIDLCMSKQIGSHTFPSSFTLDYLIWYICTFIFNLLNQYPLFDDCLIQIAQFINIIYFNIFLLIVQGCLSRKNVAAKEKLIQTPFIVMNTCVKKTLITYHLRGTRDAVAAVSCSRQN